MLKEGQTIILANEDQLKPSNQIIAHPKNKGLPFFRYGVKTNIGGSSHTYPNEYFKGKSSLSSEMGLMTQLKTSKNFSLQSEVLYSTMGSKAGYLYMAETYSRWFIQRM